MESIDCLWIVLYLCYLIEDKVTASQNCPVKCSNCKFDSRSQLTSATCVNVRIQTLPNSLVDLTVKDLPSPYMYVPLGLIRPFYFNTKVELQTLTIDNYGIKSLIGPCFEKNTQLTTLRLTNNPLKDVTEENFQGLVYLQNLDLSQNNLVNLSDFVFRQLTAMKELKLLLNNLTTIGENSLKGLINIETVDLRSNLISSIHRDAFSGLVTLREVNLQSNRVTRLEAGTFSNLNNLMTINLRNNRLVYIDPDSVTGAPSLNNINLAHNQLKTLPSLFMQKISNFQMEINLSRNNLTTLKAGDLSKVRLKALFLVGNQINIVEATALKDSFIQKFDLQQNQLHHLPEELKKYINQSTVILLANNPWTCDCDIYWMPSILTNGTQEPVCTEPISYRGSKVSDFAKTVNMACASGSLPVPTKILPQPPKQGIITPALSRRPSTGSNQLDDLNTTTIIPTDNDKGSNKAPIIAGSIAGLFLLIGVAVAVIYLHMKHGQSKVHGDYCDKEDFNFNSKFDKNCIQSLVPKN